MSRNTYLVAYDICGDEKRLRKIHQCMCGYGYSLQYSVFLCSLDQVELIDLKTEMSEIMNHGDDSVMIVSLGPSETAVESHFEFMGVTPPKFDEGAVVI